MGSLNFQQAMKMFSEQSRIPNLLWLYGEELFFIDELLKTLKSKSIPVGLDDFNYEVFYAADAKMSDVIRSLDTLPVMSPSRLVLLKEAHSLKEKETEELLRMISKPLESTCFALISHKVDKRKKLFKEFEKKGVTIELARPYENQMGYWVEYIGKRCGLTIASNASAALVQIVGTNLSEIKYEMDKLSDFKGPTNRNVSLDDVSLVVSRAKLENIFELSHALGAKDRVEALNRLCTLLAQGQNEIGALALLVRHLRLLLSIQEGLKEGLQGSRLARKAGVAEFFLKRYLEQVRFWSSNKLENAFCLARETDKAIKSSPLSSHIWLENFILQACH